jgi:hypothetical protein
MKPDPNFPRMMFHRTEPPVTVHTQQELDALDPAQWSTKLYTGEEPPEPEASEEEEETEPDEGEEHHTAKEPPKRPAARKPVPHSSPKPTRRVPHRK